MGVFTLGYLGKGMSMDTVERELDPGGGDMFRYDSYDNN